MIEILFGGFLFRKATRGDIEGFSDDLVFLKIEAEKWG